MPVTGSASERWLELQRQSPSVIDWSSCGHFTEQKLEIFFSRYFSHLVIGDKTIGNVTLCDCFCFVFLLLFVFPLVSLFCYFPPSDCSTTHFQSDALVGKQLLTASRSFSDLFETFPFFKNSIRLVTMVPRADDKLVEGFSCCLNWAFKIISQSCCWRCWLEVKLHSQSLVNNKQAGPLLLLLKVMLSWYALHRTGHGQELGQSQNLHSCYDQRPERVTVTKQHLSALWYKGAVFLSFHQSVPLLTQPSFLPPFSKTPISLLMQGSPPSISLGGKGGVEGTDSWHRFQLLSSLLPPPGHLHLSSWGKWLHFGK